MKTYKCTFVCFVNEENHIMTHEIISKNLKEARKFAEKTLDKIYGPDFLGITKFEVVKND